MMPRTTAASFHVGKSVRLHIKINDLVLPPIDELADTRPFLVDVE
jgi:hypothetical protein